MRLNPLTILIPMLLLVSACNTMEGLGQDVQNTGTRLEEKANESK